jgi:hypothetical protein
VIAAGWLVGVAAAHVDVCEPCLGEHEQQLVAEVHVHCERVFFLGDEPLASPLKGAQLHSERLLEWIKRDHAREQGKLGSVRRGPPLSGLWGAEIRFSCREPVFVDQSAKSISSLDAV